MNKAQIKLYKKLQAWREEETDPRILERLNDLMNLHLKGVYISEEDIKRAQLFGIRNSAFRGDMVGWLDDDLDDDYDKDDE
jgi:hypothetical protein